MKIVYFPEATNNAAGIHFYADPQGFTVIAIDVDKNDIKNLQKTGRLYVIAGPGFAVPPPMQITLDNPFKPLPVSKRQNNVMITTSTHEKENQKSTGDDEQPTKSDS